MKSRTSHALALPGGPATLRRLIPGPRSGLAPALLHLDTGDRVGAGSPAAYATH